MGEALRLHRQRVPRRTRGSRDILTNFDFGATVFPDVDDAKMAPKALLTDPGSSPATQIFSRTK